MNYVLKILRKHLANEQTWLRSEYLGAMDPKYLHGARMAKERIPQLEKAIELVGSFVGELKPKKLKPPVPNQLPLFKIPDIKQLLK